MTIQGLDETHIRVADFARSRAFYEAALGLAVGWLDVEQRRVLYWVGPRGRAMLGLRQVPKTEVSWHHCAFQVSVNDVLHSASFLKARGIASHNLIDGRATPQVFAWMPAVALFFEDPDRHLLEFIAMLPGAPRPDLGSLTWDEWTRRTS